MFLRRWRLTCIPPSGYRFCNWNTRQVKTVSQCDAQGSRLSSGTSPERIAPESLTPVLSGFVHRNISRGPIIRGTRSSLDGLDKPGKQSEILNRTENAESNQKRARVNRIPSHFRIRGPHPSRRGENAAPQDEGLPPLSRFSVRGPGPTLMVRSAATPRVSNHESHDARTGYCVLATRGGVAWVMNWVASSIAGPSGVGIFIQNGTRMRVPATGAKAISIWRWAARYLITARSGI
jgi:hypothetical protein